MRRNAICYIANLDLGEAFVMLFSIGLFASFSLRAHYARQLENYHSLQNFFGKSISQNKQEVP